MHIHIPGHNSDGQDFNFWRAQRHDQRDGVVGGGIGINQEWTIHATQDSKLASGTRHKKISAISTSSQLALPAGNFSRILGTELIRPISQPAAASADFSDCDSLAAPKGLAVIS